MSLLVADLLALANSRTGRAETDNDKFLLPILHDLTIRGCFLEAEETVTLSSEDPSYAFSTFTNDFKSIKTVVIIDSDDDPSGPLQEISWTKYKERLAQTLSAGEPVEYCIYPGRINRVLYLSPKPNTTNYPYVKISGPIRHADSTSSISFPERFRELLVEGMAWQIERHYNPDSTKTAEHKGYYENELAKHFGDTPTVSRGRYSDI
jgi:hypothetical protein